MRELDFWHAVLLSKDLKEKKPVGVTVAGRELALFRTTGGQAAAVADQCPHRRMRLSRGWVKEGRLVCPYHGWSFDREGGTRTPLSDEPLRACVQHYDCKEQHGIIWVKNAGTQAEIPQLHNPAHRLFSTMRHRLHAPLELVLDNFAELEHSYTAHVTFGFGDLRDATIETKVEGNMLHIVQRGRPKQLPPVLLLLLFGMRPEDRFEAELKMGFEPPCMLSEHHKVTARDPNTVQRTGVQFVFFYTPVTEVITDLYTLTFLSPAVDRLLWLLPGLGHGLLYGLVDYENRRDKEVLDHLASKDTDLRGMKLGRFDKPLGQLRVLLDRLYRGNSSPVRLSEGA